MLSPRDFHFTRQLLLLILLLLFHSLTLHLSISHSPSACLPLCPHPLRDESVLLLFSCSSLSVWTENPICCLLSAALFFSSLFSPPLLCPACFPRFARDTHLWAAAFFFHFSLSSVQLFWAARADARPRDRGSGGGEGIHKHSKREQ